MPLRYPGNPRLHTPFKVPTNINIHCAHEESWGNSESFNLEDCPAAIDSVESAEDLDPMRAAVPKEFITRDGVPQGSHGDPFRTPRKYDTGKSRQPFMFGLINMMFV